MSKKCVKLASLQTSPLPTLPQSRLAEAYSFKLICVGFGGGGR